MYSLVGICLLGGTSCSTYDDSWIKETTQGLENRIAALEEWQTTVNNNISSLQDLITALEDKDYVTGVTPLSDGKGYVISFHKSGDITIKNGEKGDKGETGDSPNISAKQDTDGKYYWAVNGEWLLSDNNKMPVTGDKGQDAIAPKVQINPISNEWEISTDDGRTYTSTGVKATGEKGDAFFEEIENTHPNYVVITLKSGEIIKLPKLTDGGIFVAVEGGLEQAVNDARIDPIYATRLKINGTLGNDDFTYLRENFYSLNMLDLENVDITLLPQDALSEMPFETVILPQGLIEIGQTAFYSCQSLRKIDIPESVKTLGR